MRVISVLSLKGLQCPGESSHLKLFVRLEGEIIISLIGIPIYEKTKLHTGVSLNSKKVGALSVLEDYFMFFIHGK